MMQQKAQPEKWFPPNMNIFVHGKVDHLFVYGTLKRTFGLNYALKECKYVCDGTLKGYLIEYGSGAFPAFVPEPTGNTIHGEIWAMPVARADRSNLMDRLDGIEGVPNLYWRMPFKVKCDAGIVGSVVAWAYFMNPEKAGLDTAKLIPSGKWAGKDNQTVGFTQYMSSSPEHEYPTKPKVKYDQSASCMIIHQSDGTGPYSHLGGLDSTDYPARKKMPWEEEKEKKAKEAAARMHAMAPIRVLIPRNETAPEKAADGKVETI